MVKKASRILLLIGGVVVFGLSAAWVLMMAGRLNKLEMRTTTIGREDDDDGGGVHPLLLAMQNGVDSNTGRDFSGERIRAYQGKRRFSVDSDVRKDDRGTARKESFLRQPNGHETIHCKKWNVVTTIFEPSDSVKRASNVKDWCTLVVGDTKTPPDYMEKLKTSNAGSSSIKNNIIRNHNDDFVVFLSVEDQRALVSKERTEDASAVGQFSEALPFRHFGRKNIGYIYAIAHGAQMIFDFDDDNLLPLSPPSSSRKTHVFPPLHDTEVLRDAAMIVTGPKVFNHHYLMRATVEGSTWPRGFPLSQIQNEATRGRIVLDAGEYRDISIPREVGVLQFMADLDPDVDAIHRLVQGQTSPHTGAPITFRRHVKYDTSEDPQQANKNYYDGTKTLSTKGALVVPSHTFVPYNAQATIHTYKAMFALLLPVTVPGRVSDIWRSYFSQRIFRDIDCSSGNGIGGDGLKVVFLPPDIEQDRNDHSLLADMEAEADLYFKTDALLSFLNEWQPQIYDERPGGDRMPSLMEELWIDLYERDYIQLEDVRVLQLWLSALVEVGYEFPQLQLQSHRRMKDVVLMGQFNYPDPGNVDKGNLNKAQHHKGNLNKEQSDEKAKTALLFWYQKWRSRFDTVVIRGPFSEELSQEFRTLHEIDVRSTRKELQQDRGFYSPTDNLASTLKQYKDKPNINGVLYVHDDILLNTTNIFFENGGPEDRSNTIYASFVRRTEFIFRTYLSSNTKEVYYMNSDGSRIDKKTEIRSPWVHMSKCVNGFTRFAQDPRSRPFLEQDSTNDGDPFFSVPNQQRSDFLYVPTRLADQFEAIALLMVANNVFLECAIPTIVDVLSGKLQKHTSAISANEVGLRFVGWCDEQGNATTRSTLEMIANCRSHYPYSIIHPYKLNVGGYKAWDRVFDWAATGSSYLDLEG